MSVATPIYHADFEADTREAVLHDLEILPHEYGEQKIECMFPRAEVGPEDAETYADVDVESSGRFTGSTATP